MGGGTRSRYRGDNRRWRIAMLVWEAEDASVFLEKVMIFVKIKIRPMADRRRRVSDVIDFSTIYYLLF